MNDERLARLVADYLQSHLPAHTPAHTFNRGSPSGPVCACASCACEPERASAHSRGAAELARVIEHTLLGADATANEILALCDEAKQHGFAAVCVGTFWVARAHARLAGSGVKVAAVVGFPLGATASAAKAFEAQNAAEAGADEIDMVLALGALKSQEYAAVLDDIRQVVQAARPAKVKVILETGLLDRDQKIAACTLARLGGAHFVKTSTGFGPGGATVEDVELMRQVVGNEMGIKASGGVRTAEDALRLLAAGADRIGTSAGVTIVRAQARDARP